MEFFISIFLSLFGFLLPLYAANFTGAQNKAEDTLAMNDISSIYAKLEEFFNENGYYPSDWDFGANDINHLVELMPGIDQEALLDQNGIKIGQNGSRYAYQGQDCTSESDPALNACQHYTLSAQLEDGTLYTKESLN